MPSVSKAHCPIVPGEASYRTRTEAAVPDPLLEQIAALEALSIDQLRSRWAEAYGRPPPACSRRQFLVRGLAHRLQENALGGLAPAQRRHLADLAARLKGDPGTTLSLPLRIKPGTRLIRAWRGERHQVTVLEHGFEYRGERHGSLSAIARAITGTCWSGPAFFGLKSRRHGNGKAHG
ncbi:MAG TPA: DUF2924 domain-containing protein [Geminicoccaceae bacterium]|jgi:hypothetical protein|nr:DUF2924 domain-containing protein [Geminicoccaceae bacterium]HEX6010597.1 DUF2924 domain-containing protein [Geminicoccaceae bacterium]